MRRVSETIDTLNDIETLINMLFFNFVFFVLFSNWVNIIIFRSITGLITGTNNELNNEFTIFFNT